MNARAKPGNVPMAAHKLGTHRFQRILASEQTADRAGILLWRAERPSRNQCVANVAMHFAPKLVGLGPVGDDALEGIPEVRERFDGIELTGADQAGADHPVLRTTIRPGEQTVLPAQGRC